MRWPWRPGHFFSTEGGVVPLLLFAELGVVLAATGGLLVALSIKYGDSVLKTLAISGSIIYAAVIDRALLGGPLTVQMVFAAIVVIVSIVNYTFDTTPEPSPVSQAAVVLSQQQHPGLAKQERLERGEASTREL